MSTIITIIAAIAVFCFLILTHELGHFLVARACGVFVVDFSLGMGPKLFCWHDRQGTQFTLRLLPVGGWCNMLGEDEESLDERAFCAKSPWKRIAILAAGPLTNFIFACLLFMLLFTSAYSTDNVVGGFTRHIASPAQSVGVEEGDRILSINGEQITNWSSIRGAVAAQPEGQPLEVEVERSGEELTFIITPVFDQEGGYWLLGVEPQLVRQNIFVAAWQGVRQSVIFVKAILVAIVGMIAGTVEVDLSGPVGIVSVISDAANESFRYLLLLTGYLCVNLGLVNLFPLPALDGSRIVFLAIEGLRGKPINRQREGMVHFIGLIMLLGLMLLLTYSDIMKLING